MKRKETREEELHEEIRNHLEMAAQERVERGAVAEDATYAARREFGNVELVKEVTRDIRGWRWLENFAQDVVYGLRMLRRDIAFTAVLVLTLAIGLGANTTIFSWIRAVLLNPLPGAAEPERVVELESLAPSGEWVPTSYLDFRDFRDHIKLLESMSVAQPMALAVGDDVYVERVWGEVVSGNFFDVLHVQPEVGRFFTGEERNDAQNAHPYRGAQPRVLAQPLRI